MTDPLNNIMKIRIVNHTPDPLMAIVKAARRCYSADDDPEFDQSRPVKNFISFLKERGHHTPFEFADFTFSICNISRSCSLQLVRHRIASYAQQSQRYCKGMPGYVIPETLWNKLQEGNIQLQNEMVKYFEALNSLLSTMECNDIPQEDQRYFWPEGTKTKIFCKFNVRSLFNFFKLRMDKHAQWEIRKLANLMYHQVSSIIPEVFPTLES